MIAVKYSASRGIALDPVANERRPGPDQYGNYHRTCQRCGRRNEVRRGRLQGVYVCGDCKSTDPDYLVLIGEKTCD